MDAECYRYIFEDSLKQNYYMSVPSTLSSQISAPPLEAQRDVGRQRVAGLLQVAGAVFQERGCEAATMAEIAARADAKMSISSFRVQSFSN